MRASVPVHRDRRGTRIRALKIYPRHNQQNASTSSTTWSPSSHFGSTRCAPIGATSSRPSSIGTLRIRGSDTPTSSRALLNSNGKVERSHRSDEEEFYQRLTYIDDVDLNAKLAAWEKFYNYDRSHGAFGGKTPYEALRSLLVSA